VGAGGVARWGRRGARFVVSLVVDRPSMSVAPALTIPIVTAVGHGATLLSSFDDALRRCGVHNYNLIALSSVIPPGTTIARPAGFHAPVDEHGHRLYVVKADARSDEPGQGVAAGIGWYQWGDARGVFVEHETVGADAAAAEREVADLIHRSLRDLCTFRGLPFDAERVGCALSVAEVEDRPTTALVLAVYRSEGWV
jgi:arginine decarboxylase